MAEYERLEGMRGVRVSQTLLSRPRTLVAAAALVFILAIAIITGWALPGQTLSLSLQLIIAAAVFTGMIGVLIGLFLRREP